MKKLLTLLIFFVCISVVSANYINDTILRSSGLNSQFTISYPWIVDNVSLEATNILVQGLNSSNPNTNTNNYSISFNFTETDINYTGLDAPYVKNISYGVHHIITNLTDDTYIDLKLGDSDCFSLYNLKYTSADGNHNKNLTYSDITCDEGYIPINVTLEQGTNIISTTFNTISNVVFRHEETLRIINDTNMTLEIIGDTIDYSRNYSTETGNLSVAMPTPGEFTFRYYGGPYQERFYFLDLSANATANLTLYVNENESVDHVTVTILDQNSDFVEDATVQLYRYDLSTNNYLLVEEGKTDFEGETRLRLTLGTEFYKFLIFYGGVLKKETSPTYIYETSLTIYINTDTDVGEVFEQSEDIAHDLEFREPTTDFKFTYTDPNSKLSRVCLDVYRITGNSKTLFNQSCETASGGILYAGIINISGANYLAQAITTIDSQQIVLEELYYKFEDAGSEIFGKNGLFILFLLTITAAGLGAAFKSGYAIMIAPLPLLLLTILGVVSISLGAALGILMLALIVGGLIQSKNE